VSVDREPLDGPVAAGRFFLPGPTEVHADVLAALAHPMLPHRGTEMEALLARIEAPLQRLFRTSRRVLLGTCSATGFMEMAVRCGVRHRALSLVSGAFGERFAAIVGATGREGIRLDVPLGETIEPDMLRDALKRSDVDAVTMVHSETSTGALAPLEQLAAVVHEFDDVLLLVDGVSSIGGSPVESDKWGLDFALTGSQKALGCPPGLALAAASERMVERAKRMPERGAYFDLLAFERAAADRQPTFTPGIPLYFALDAQLARIEREGGVEARWRRHDAMRLAVESWIAEQGGDLGFSFICRPERRSWAVSCLHVPQGIHGRELVQRVKGLGWILGTGYGGLKPTSIRIGHMGDHTPEGVKGLLAAIEEALVPAA
jgi:aspartate aminotransferase-like enzyme